MCVGVGGGGEVCLPDVKIFFKLQESDHMALAQGQSSVTE